MRGGDAPQSVSSRPGTAPLSIALYSLRRYAEAAQAIKRMPKARADGRPGLRRVMASSAVWRKLRAEVAAILKAKPDYSINEFMN